MLSKITSIILLVYSITICQANFVTLKSVEGVSIKARILSKSEESVSFERIDGVVFSIPISRLSEDSQHILNKWNPIEFTWMFENGWDNIRQVTMMIGQMEVDEIQLKIKSSSGEEMKISKKYQIHLTNFLARVRSKIEKLSKENVPNGFTFLLPMIENGAWNWKIAFEGNEWRIYMPNQFTHQKAGNDFFWGLDISNKYLKESTYLYWKDFLEKFDFNKELLPYIELWEKTK